jgi:small subunit ribosomal protein S1
MVDRDLLRECEPGEEQLLQELASLDRTEIENDLLVRQDNFRANRILKGRVVSVENALVYVDIGFKGPGAIPLWEFEYFIPAAGEEVDVLLLGLDESGSPRLSYRLARENPAWEDFLATHTEGHTVSGTVLRALDAGLVVNIGARAFLPASQVDVRPVGNLADFVGRQIECRILRIDRVNRKVVVSRRQLLPHGCPARARILPELEPGQQRQGVVKNIADFGAFVDLGGIDGLLHVSDMAWEPVTNPRDVVQIDQVVEVVVLQVDRERERVSLGLKQKTPNPCENIDSKYPVGSRHTAEVARILAYGFYARLEPGVAGLVHLADMSWTRRLAHPCEMVAEGGRVEVQVLAVNNDRGEISLGMKQLVPNPWDGMAQRHPVGTVLTAVVRHITNYGAFLEIEEGVDGLLHIADLQRTPKPAHPSEVVSKGDRVACVVLHVDAERKRIWLGLRRLPVEASWLTPAVLSVARVIDREGQVEDLPILADALEEAGCVDAALLNYLRGPGPHVRDCCAVGLVPD